MWVFDEDPSPEELKLREYLEKQTKDAELAVTTSRMWSLYQYVMSQNFKSPQEIEKSAYHDKELTKPIFTKRTARSLYNMLSPMKGGAEDVEAYDALIRRMISFVRGWTPQFVLDVTDSTAPYVFILKTMEQNPSYGPLLGVALDATVSTLPVISTTIQNMAPELIGLIPIPEASLVGVVVGWLLASTFVILNMAIHVSRDHFGEAFVVSFGLIPLVGTSLYNAALSGQRFLGKLSKKRSKLINSARLIAGDGTADLLDGIVPDLTFVPSETAPPPTAGKRLSTKRHFKSKWRTMRQSRSGKL